MTQKPKIEEPKDLGVKVAVNEVAALWTRVRDETMAQIKQAENNLIVQKAVMKMAEEKILGEQSKS